MSILRLSGEVGLRAKLLATTVVLGLVGVVGGYGTWSAFTSTTANAGNDFAAGTVTISDNDGDPGVAMFSLDNLKPGEPGAVGAKCIKVNYTGSLDATVKLYGSTTSGSLGTYLNVKVTRGTIAGTHTFPSCTGFLADTTEYISGKGLGVVYDGTLAAFPGTYDGGIGYPASAWPKNTAAVYKFEASVQDNNNAQGQSATGVKFTWEARS